LARGRRRPTLGRAARGDQVLLGHGLAAHVALAQNDEPSGLVQHVGEHRAPGVADIPLASPACPVLKLRHGDGVPNPAGLSQGQRRNQQ
ncbi:hypothetical protein RZS08_05150, partial [Arthrospira platensis SPKY1]|nr:hypothetical protein [Arthrospira platensis SPKY1]